MAAGPGKTLGRWLLLPCCGPHKKGGNRTRHWNGLLRAWVCCGHALNLDVCPRGKAVFTNALPMSNCADRIRIEAVLKLAGLDLPEIKSFFFGFLFDPSILTEIPPCYSAFILDPGISFMDSFFFWSRIFLDLAAFTQDPNWDLPISTAVRSARDSFHFMVYVESLSTCFH